MPQARSLGLLLLVALLGGTVWWLLDGAPPPAPAPVVGTAPAQPDGGPVAPAHGNDAPAIAPDEPQRTALAPVVATANGPALVGKVIDESGAPIAKAIVASGIGINGGGPNFDPRDFDPNEFADDPTKAMERMRERLAQSTTTETAADGTFRLVPSGTGRMVGITVRARGYQQAQRQAARPTTADVEVGAVTVARGAVVRGRVLDRANAPIAGASVSRRNGDARTQFDFEAFAGEGMDLMRGMMGDVTSDADGRFELPNAAPGDFSLRARHPLHPSATTDKLTVAVGATLDGVLVVMADGASIQGRVLDVPAGVTNLRVLAAPPRDAAAMANMPGMQGMANNPQFGAMVTQFQDALGDMAIAAERSAAVAADGTFAIDGLAVGVRYRVWAAQGGRGMPGAAVCSQRVEVQSGTLGVELRFDPGSSVTVRVVDARTKAPVETLWVRDQFDGGNGIAGMLQGGMQAAMRGGQGGRARQYPGGLVTVGGLRPQKQQKLRLTIEALGYARSEQRGLELPPTGALDLGTIELTPVPIVQIEVVHKATGAPVADATVRLRGQRDGGAGGGRGGRGNRGGAPDAGGGNGGDPMAAFGAGMNFGMGMGGGGITTARTDAEGRCTLNALEGPFTVQVEQKEHAPYASDALTIAADQPKVAHRAELVTGGSVEVAVVDADGKPVTDARVEHGTPTGDNDGRPTDGKGLATFDHLAPGMHRFRLGTNNGMGGMGAMFGGRGGRRGGANAAPEVEWQRLEVADGQSLQLQLAKNATATLSGLVRENGAPLANARVAFVAGAADDAATANDPMAAAMAAFGGGGGRGSNARTGDDGRYTLKELRPGDHRVRVTHGDRSMPTTVRVFLRAGDNVLDIDLASAVVRGTVLDPQGKPVGGATVRVAAASDVPSPLEGLGGMGMQFPGMGGGGGRSEAKSAADGRYELKGVQTGVPLIVRAQAKGFAGTASAPFEAPASGAREGVDVTLLASGSVRVRASETQPFAAVVATMQGDAGKGIAPVFALLGNGTALLEGLRPGRWEVAIRGMQNQGQPTPGRPVDVIAGQTVEVQL